MMIGSAKVSLVLNNKTRGQFNCRDGDHSPGDLCRSWPGGTQARGWAVKIAQKEEMKTG